VRRVRPFPPGHRAAREGREATQELLHRPRQQPDIARLKLSSGSCEQPGADNLYRGRGAYQRRFYEPITMDDKRSRFPGVNI